MNPGIRTITTIFLTVTALLIVAAMVTIVAEVVQARPRQGAPAPVSKYQPSEVQLLRLQLRLKDAQLAQVALQRAQAQFQGALAVLDEESGKVKRDNGWPATVQFSPESLTFTDPPTQAAPTPAAPVAKP